MMYIFVNKILGLWTLNGFHKEMPSQVGYLISNVTVHLLKFSNLIQT